MSAEAIGQDRRPEVAGFVNYIAETGERLRYYDVDHSKDRLPIDSRPVTITDARGLKFAPNLDREGFTLVHHPTVVGDHRNYDGVADLHRCETEALLREVSGADAVVQATPAAFRFSERSSLAGNARSSLPARHVHVDYSDAGARHKALQLAPRDGVRIQRFAHYNVWRVLTPPPQDSPLAVCDARSVSFEDLMPVDVICDTPTGASWTFEGIVVRHNPAHRWVYWSNMRTDEALIFKTYDSDPTRAHCVPHSAFDDPTCPADVPPRISVEMRGIAFWYG